MERNFDVKEAFGKLAEEILTVAATNLPCAQVKALEAAHNRESVTAAKAQIDTMLKNIDLARVKCSSICQDPGIPVFDLAIGSQFPLEFDIRAS